VLLALWSPKGGSGTSVLAAACASVLARSGGCRLVDLAGDQPAVLGLGTDPETGVAQWLAAGPEAPVDALARLATEVAPGLHLIAAGAPRVLAPAAAAARMVVEVADASVIVLRGCYLSLRRAVHHPLTRRAVGVAFVDEPGRALGPNEVREVLERPVLTRVPVRGPIARAVDAGVIAVRTPEPLARAAARVLERALPSAPVAPARA